MFRDIWRVVQVMKNVLLVVCTPLLLLPLPFCVPGQESRCAYVILIMAVFWMTEALPINVTALLPVFLFPVLGVVSADVVAKAFFTNTTLMFIGGMTIAVAIEEWNIHKRIALKTLLIMGSKPAWLMLGLMLTSWFLSMWISNTATTTMMLPIATAILNQLRQYKQAKMDDEDSAVCVELVSTDNRCQDTVKRDAIQNDKQLNGHTLNAADEDDNSNDNDDSAATDDDDKQWKQMATAFSLCIAYSANIGGTGSLTGTTPNLVLKDQSDLVYAELGVQNPLNFGTWLAIGIPTSLVIVVLSWLWMYAFHFGCSGWSCCRKPRGHIDESMIKQVVSNQYKKLGKISFGQIAVILHLVGIALLWITRDMGGTYGWSTLFKDKFIKDSVPAIFVGCLLFIFPAKSPFRHATETEKITPVPPLLPWKRFVDKMPWGVVFLLGGGFSMAKAAQESGLSDWFGGQLESLDSLPPWTLCLVVCFIVAAITEIASNTATTVLLLPMLAQIAISMGLEPLYLMFPAAVASSYAFMLPVATPPNAIVFSYGHIKVLHMVKSGFVLNIIAVSVLVASNELLAKSFFSS